MKVGHDSSYFIWKGPTCLGTCAIQYLNRPKNSLALAGNGSLPLKLERNIGNIVCNSHKNAENETIYHFKGVTGASLDYPSSNRQVIWYLAISSLPNPPLRKRKGSALVLPYDQPRCSASSSACEPAPLNLSHSSSPSPWHPQTPWQNDIHTPRYPRSHPTASLGASPWAGRSGCSHSWRALLHGKPG